MRLNYSHGKPITSKMLRRLASPLFLTVFVGTLLIVLVAFVLVDLWVQNHDESYPQSKTIVSEAPLGIKFYSTPYFQFADIGNWRYAKDQSRNNIFVFQKYLGKSNIVQHRLTVYINQTPIPLYLASPRTIPVKVRNGNVFEPGDVSQPCGQTYGTNELHKIKTKNFAGTTILCDPDLTEYRVVFGRTGGDYRIKLKRNNGSYATYIIIYQALTISPRPDTVKQIADSFQAL